MANTTFKGNVRSENGFTQFSTNGTKVLKQLTLLLIQVVT